MSYQAPLGARCRRGALDWPRRSQALGQPLLLAPQRLGHVAVRDRVAHQGVERFAEQGAAGHVRVELQHALIEEHEAVAAVVDLDARRHGLDGVAASAGVRARPRGARHRARAGSRPAR